MKKRKWHEIYVISDGTEWFKVGIAADTRLRLRDLQVGNPRLLTLVASVPVVRKRLRAAEVTAHDILGAYHRQGEWFKTTKEAAIEAITQAAGQWQQFLSKQPKFPKIARYGEKAYVAALMSEIQ